MDDSEKEKTSDKEKKDDENNVVLSTEQMALLEDQRQELADLRRQVVFLQVSDDYQSNHSVLSLGFCLKCFVDKQTNLFASTLFPHQSKLVN